MSVVRAVAFRIEQWVDDDSALLACAKMFFLIAVGLGAVTAPIFWLAAREEATEQARCLASGRGWAIAGQRVGVKGMVDTYYGCFEVRR